MFSLNKSSTNDSSQIPLPSIEPFSLNLLISNLKTRFDKLEDALFQKGEDEVYEYVETLFARLSTDIDLDQAIASLSTLNDILMKEPFYSYIRILRGNFDNILFLCGREYVLFGTTYHKVEPNCVEEVKRVQHLLESSTQLLTSLLLHSPMKLVAEMARTNLYYSYFIKCTMIYLASYISTCPAHPTRPFQLFPSFNFRSLYVLVTQMVNGWYRYNCVSEQPNPNKSLLSHVQLNMKATLLRLYREFVAQSVKTEAVDLSSKKMLKMNIDAMAKLFEFLCPNYCYDEYFSNKDVIYEIYSIFELFSELDNSVLERHAKPFWLIKYYISWLFSKLGYDFRICAENAVWKQFKLVDKEIAASGRNSQDVPLFKYLAECGFSRSGDQDDGQIEMMIQDQVMQSVQELTKTKVDCETPIDPSYTNNRPNLSRNRRFSLRCNR